MMKKIITILLLFVSLNLFSQDEKPITQGHFLIGGSASGGYYMSKNSDSNNSTKNIDASFSPSIGYFVTDGLAFGISLNSSIYKGLEDNDYSEFSGGIGPMLKIYTPFGLFAGGSVNYSLYNYKYDTTKSNENRISITPQLGYAYFINSKVALETSVNYSYQFSNHTYEYDKERNDSNYRYNQIYFSIGFQIFL